MMQHGLSMLSPSRKETIPEYYMNLSRPLTANAMITLPSKKNGRSQLLHLDCDDDDRPN
jgi:hypothetical protein